MTDYKARIREMEDEIEDAKATAHERGYYQGKAAGDAFGAAMREHVTRLEAENKALREAAAAIKEHTDTARKKMRMVYAAPVWSAIISHLDVEHDRILALIEGDQTDG